MSTVASAAVVPRKRQATTEQWLEAWQHANAVPDHAGAHELVAIAVDRVRAAVAKTGARRPAYAWTGGKDSLGLEIVCRAAGVNVAMIGCTRLEYPSMERWIDAHAPPGLDVQRMPFDLAWLAARQERWCLPYTQKDAYLWYSAVNWNSQRAWCERTGCDLLLNGRRKADGNNMGRGGYQETKYSSGTVKFAPCGDWTHEDLLNVLVVHRVELPPIYQHARGWLVGSGCWAKRRALQDGDTVNRHETWREVWCADRDVVREAAGTIVGARRFLEQEGLT